MLEEDDLDDLLAGMPAPQRKDDMDHPDLIVMEPDGAPYLVHFGEDESPRDAARRVLGEPAGTQGMGRLRAYFADDFGSLSNNVIADRVLQGIGYHHPTGWRGTVLLTMEESPEGNIDPLEPEVIAAVEDLIGKPLHVLHVQQ